MEKVEKRTRVISMLLRKQDVEINDLVMEIQIVQKQLDECDVSISTIESAAKKLSVAPSSAIDAKGCVVNFDPGQHVLKLDYLMDLKERREVVEKIRAKLNDSISKLKDNLGSLRSKKKVLEKKYESVVSKKKTILAQREFQEIEDDYLNGMSNKSHD